MPALRWEATVKERTLTLRVTSDRGPRAVRAWVATASTKDFREARWEAFEMHAERHGYVYRRDQGPEGGEESGRRQVIAAGDGIGYSSKRWVLPAASCFP